MLGFWQNRRFTAWSDSNRKRVVLGPEAPIGPHHELNLRPTPLPSSVPPFQRMEFTSNSGPSAHAKMLLSEELSPRSAARFHGREDLDAAGARLDPTSCEDRLPYSLQLLRPLFRKALTCK